MTFHFLYMANSTILIMLFDELSEDVGAFRFSLKIGINTITPVIQLYLGGISGIASCLFYVFKNLSTFTAIFGVTFVTLCGFVFNDVYYQVNVKALQDTLNIKAKQVIINFDEIQNYFKEYIRRCNVIMIWKI